MKEISRRLFNCINKKTIVNIFVECLFILFSFTFVEGHDPGLSAAEVRLDNDALRVGLSFARNDIQELLKLDQDADGEVSSGEFEAAKLGLQSLAENAVEIRFDNQRAKVSVISVTLDEGNAIQFDLTFSKTNAGRLYFYDGIIPRLAQGHRQYFSFIDEQGRRLNEKLLDADNSSVEIDLQSLEAEKPQTFTQFILLGIQHILTGFDHLAFLFALLLVSGSLRETAKIITSFTLAHSISLAFATFDIIQLPPTVVEPLIALSIIYIGLENVFRREINRRWLLTFAFGLVHGLGFATVLRELGIGSDIGQTIAPLLSFNLGVELGQIAIAALVLPLIWKLKERPSFIPRYVPACSVLLALLGGYWLVERTLF